MTAGFVATATPRHQSSAAQHGVRRLKKGNIRTSMENKTSAWIQIVSVVSLLIGLALVFVEIRQSNQIASAQTQLNLYTSRIDAHNLVLSQESGIAEFKSKLRTTPFEELTDTEVERLIAFVAANFNLWVSIQIQYDLDLLPIGTITAWQNDIANFTTEFPAANQVVTSLYLQNPNVQKFEIFLPLQRHIENENSNNEPQ